MTEAFTETVLAYLLTKGYSPQVSTLLPEEYDTGVSLWFVPTNHHILIVYTSQCVRIVNTTPNMGTQRTRKVDYCDPYLIEKMIAAIMSELLGAELWVNQVVDLID